MRIRSHLLLLVGGALLPLLLFASALTGYSWWQQRHAVEQRQLERVRAVTISIDTELQAIVRGARALALAPDLAGHDMDASVPRMQRILGAQPLWSMLALTDGEGTAQRVVQRAGAPAENLSVDSAMIRQVSSTKAPAVSGLVRTPSGRFQTQVAVPVLEGGEVAMMVVVAVDPRSWLAFMGQFPLAKGSTLTLLDQNHVVIARTLNNDDVVGRVAAPDYVKQATESAEGAYRARGIEGQQFLAAHSRSPRWGWTVATGLPVDTVNAALRDTSIALVLGAMLSIGLAVLLAILFGRRIEAPIRALGVSARRLARGEAVMPPSPDEAARIDEVDRVGEAFSDSARRLREREAALNAALAREQEARHGAEEASRAKDEFLAMLGHELRNPLNAIANAAAVLERSPVDPGRTERLKAVIRRQVKALRDLVDDLLDVARVTSGKIVLSRRPLELGAAVRRAVSVLEAAGRLERHEVRVAAGEAWVNGDDTRVEQLVTNLVDNAVKYTPEGGHVDVVVEANGEEARVVVRDDGMGIAPDLMPRVFDLFTQGERTIDRSQGGLGLGLSLVRRLAELHGGRASAESAGPGQGATFTVCLPRILRPAEAPVPEAEPGTGTEPKRILVVEDNPDGRETLMTVLEMQGHEVQGADSGPAGLEALRRFRPHLAIVDIGLPGFDGFELARRARALAETARTRLVALTGYGQDEDRAHARRAGFDGFLVKPADFAAIAAIIQQVH